MGKSQFTSKQNANPHPPPPAPCITYHSVHPQPPSFSSHPTRPSPYSSPHSHSGCACIVQHSLAHTSFIYLYICIYYHVCLCFQNQHFDSNDEKMGIVTSPRGALSHVYFWLPPSLSLDSSFDWFVALLLVCYFARLLGFFVLDWLRFFCFIFNSGRRRGERGYPTLLRFRCASDPWTMIKPWFDHEKVMI